jgi:hypothetical protein
MGKRQVGEFGSGWYFPDLEGPDLSVPIHPLEAIAAELLCTQTVYEIFDEAEAADEWEQAEQPAQVQID